MLRRCTSGSAVNMCVLLPTLTLRLAADLILAGLPAPRAHLSGRLRDARKLLSASFLPRASLPAGMAKGTSHRSWCRSEVWLRQGKLKATRKTKGSSKGGKN